MLHPAQLKLIMRPLVRLFLRQASSIHEFSSIAKTVFVEIAEEEIRRAGDAPNVSRISAMTGLYRKEVAQIFKNQSPPLYQGASLIARVLAKWENDRRFSSARGIPKRLSFGTSTSEFSALVASVSTDTHEGTILNELKRAGLVEITPQGACLRKREALIPGDINKALKVIEDNVESCLSSGLQNAIDAPEPRNLHLRTTYDNLYQDKLPEIRRWVLEQGREFHRRLREFLAPLDADVEVGNDPERPSGGKIVVSSFSVAEARAPARTPPAHESRRSSRRASK